MLNEHINLLETQKKKLESVALSEMLIKATYQKIKYWCLNDLKRPYIFAYSALINEEIRLNTIEAGFDGCLISPITVESINDCMTNFIDKYVTQFMAEQLLSLSQSHLLEQLNNNKEKQNFLQESIIIEDQQEHSDNERSQNS